MQVYVCLCVHGTQRSTSGATTQKQIHLLFPRTDQVGEPGCLLSPRDLSACVCFLCSVITVYDTASGFRAQATSGPHTFTVRTFVTELFFQLPRDSYRHTLMFSLSTIYGEKYFGLEDLVFNFTVRTL